jgi:hypothetical protein
MPVHFDPYLVKAMRPGDAQKSPNRFFYISAVHCHIDIKLSDSYN